MSKYNETEIDIGSFVTSRHLSDDNYPFSDGLIKGKVIGEDDDFFNVLTISHRDLGRVGQTRKAYKINCVKIYE